MGGIALLVGAYADRIASLFGLLDYPDSDGGRKRHAKVTPLVGGLAVAIVSVAAALIVRAALPPPTLHLAWLAGAVTVNVVTADTSAAIGTDAKLTATAGDIDVTARQNIGVQGVAGGGAITTSSGPLGMLPSLASSRSSSMNAA